jgi:hypothetical protein
MANKHRKVWKVISHKLNEFQKTNMTLIYLRRFIYCHISHIEMLGSMRQNKFEILILASSNLIIGRMRV